MENKELAKELKKWFDNATLSKNKWNRDPVGIVIKEELKKLGQWKYRPRGVLIPRGLFTKLRNGVRSLKEHRDWRDAIKLRDGDTCQGCLQKSENIHIHHKTSLTLLIEDFLKTTEERDAAELIKKLKDYAPFWDIENGMVICDACHAKEHPAIKNFVGMGRSD